jgi:hypothetical protein
MRRCGKPNSYGKIEARHPDRQRGYQLGLKLLLTLRAVAKAVRSVEAEKAGPKTDSNTLFALGFIKIL